MSLTVVEKLLVAAAKLDEQRNQRSFSAEDLVVAAWSEFPGTFGLRGYLNDVGDPEYPDSNRVFVEIMGSRPIRKRGYLRKVGTKMYALTDVGRDAAIRLIGSDGGRKATAPRRLRLGREIVAEVQRLHDSQAARKIADGRESDLTFHDACLFWGITPRSVAIELLGRRASIQEVVAEARSYLSGASISRQSGPEFSVEMLELIDQTDRNLANKFDEEIETILGRTDERKG